VLVQGLLELKGAVLSDKLNEDFWKFLIENAWLFRLVGNYELCCCVLSVAFQQLINTSRTISSFWFELSIAELLQPEVQADFSKLTF